MIYGTFITLPSTQEFASSTLGTVAGPLISDFNPYTSVIIGTLIAIIAVTSLIAMLRHRG